VVIGLIVKGTRILVVDPPKSWLRVPQKVMPRNPDKLAYAKSPRRKRLDVPSQLSLNADHNQSTNISSLRVVKGLRWSGEYSYESIAMTPRRLQDSVPILIRFLTSA